MAMYDDETKDQYKEIEFSCKNCDRHILFLIVPKNQPVLGEPFCNLKCIEDYVEKQKKIKENMTEHTLK